MLKTSDKQNDVITAGTGAGDGNKTDTDANKVGLAYTHAFTLIGVLELSTGEKLVQMRNPWGSETYKGAWSDKSKKWTKKAMKETGHTKADDGVFWIELADYVTNF